METINFGRNPHRINEILLEKTQFEIDIQRRDMFLSQLYTIYFELKDEV